MAARAASSRRQRNGRGGNVRHSGPQADAGVDGRRGIPPRRLPRGQADGAGVGGPGRGDCGRRGGGLVHTGRWRLDIPPDGAAAQLVGRPAPGGARLVLQAGPPSPVLGHRPFAAARPIRLEWQATHAAPPAPRRRGPLPVPPAAAHD
eukprot:scaffold11156_cov101-Isochrysis_galbana.AAC.2